MPAPLPRHCAARSLLLAHPALLPDTISVRFGNILEANAVLRVEAGVKTTGCQEYLAIAEELNLRIVEIVQGACAVFSGPRALDHPPKGSPA